MSKGDGLKIGIKFTEDLIGDVTGSKDAFTITGKEYQYVNGALIDKEYEVDVVEKYPARVIYEDDFTGAMDGVEVGVNGVVLDGEEGEEESTIVAATSQHNSSYPGLYARVVMQKNATVTKVQFKAVSAGTYTFKVQDSTGETTHRETTAVSTGDNTVVEFEITPIVLIASTEYRFVFEYPSGKTRHTNRTFSGSLWVCPQIYVYNLGLRNITPGMNIITAGEYSTPGTYTTTIPADTLPTDPCLKWTEDLPTGTNITVEYAVNQDGLTTPITWTLINNNDLLTIPDPTTGYFLWLKFTLATTDITTTPTLSKVWLEEAESPQNKILITIDWWSRFNNAEDKIKVLYDASKGSLTGAGGAVESFEVEFTPTDLVQTPNPNEEELIKAYPYEIVLDLNELEYKNGYLEETIKAYPYEIVLNLINVDEINP